MVYNSIGFKVFPDNMESFQDCYEGLNPFQPSLVCHKETSHFICIANQMAGFCMKSRNGLTASRLGEMS